MEAAGNTAHLAPVPFQKHPWVGLRKVTGSSEWSGVRNLHVTNGYEKTRPALPLCIHATVSPYLCAHVFLNCVVRVLCADKNNNPESLAHARSATIRSHSIILQPQKDDGNYFTNDVQNT